jgi:hypothetical protein
MIVAGIPDSTLPDTPSPSTLTATGVAPYVALYTLPYEPAANGACSNLKAVNGMSKFEGRADIDSEDTAAASMLSVAGGAEGAG